MSCRVFHEGSEMPSSAVRPPSSGTQMRDLPRRRVRQINSTPASTPSRPANVMVRFRPICGISTKPPVSAPPIAPSVFAV